MSDDFMNLIRREIERVFAERNKPARIGLVTSYDPVAHAAKVMFQPEGKESGWIPIKTSHSGNGYGILVGLTPGDGTTTGDQVEVSFQEGDHETGGIIGRLHSDIDKPPVVQAGEILARHSSGSSFLLAKDGSATVTDKSGASWKMDGAGNITVTNSGTFQVNAATINLVGNCHLGSTGGVAAAQLGTVDTGGNADITNLATKVWVT